MSVSWWINGNSLWRGICHIQEWSLTSSAAIISACIIQMAIKTLIYYLIGCSRSITGLSTSDPSKWLMSQQHHMPLFSVTFKTNYPASKDTHTHTNTHSKLKQTSPMPAEAPVIFTVCCSLYGASTGSLSDGVQVMWGKWRRFITGKSWAKDSWMGNVLAILGRTSVSLQMSL